MTKSFDYCYVREAMDSITIENIGNCIIEGATDRGWFYYLIVRTEMGVTRILEYGPYIDGGFPVFMNESFQQMDYNEKKISRRIEKFLQISNLTQVRQIENIDEIKDNLINPIELMEF